MDHYNSDDDMAPITYTILLPNSPSPDPPGQPVMGSRFKRDRDREAMPLLYSKSRRLDPITPSSTEATTSSQTLSPTAARSENTSPSNISILSLPDDIISRVFTHLNASDTSGPLSRPRHAFALATTNTRLLRIFRTHLKHITPDLTYGFTPPTLRTSHFLALTQLAGPVLRELHTPVSSDRLLARLPYLSPQLKKLTIAQRRDIKLSEALLSQLDSLSIVNPLSEALKSLVPMPEKLTLTNVSKHSVPEIMEILRQPPKKLVLHLKEIASGNQASFMAGLCEACVKMEEIVLKAPYKGNTNKVFLLEAIRILETPRPNTESSCRKMAIDGPFKELFKHAHPDAILEVTRGHQTFVRDGKVVYAKKLPLWEEYLDIDVSRLTEIYIPNNFDMEWRTTLSGVHLSCAEVESWAATDGLDLSVEVLTGPTWKVQRMHQTVCLSVSPKWHCYRNVREVCLMGPWKYLKLEYDLIFFLYNLENVFNSIDGKVVRIDSYVVLYVRKFSDPLDIAISRVICALDKFEAGGGNADGIRAWITGGIRLG